MFIGITSQVGALATAVMVLTGGAILRDGPAAAAPNEDEQFLALLEKQEIPALRNVPSLIATAHDICRRIDAGTPADALVNAMVHYAYSVDPTARRYAPDRLARTEARFITAAVEAYCPGNESKLTSIMVNLAPGSNESMHRVAAYTRGEVNPGSDLPEPPSGDMINMPVAWHEPTRSGEMRLPHLMNGVFVGGRYGDDRPDCDAHGAVLASLIGAVPSGDITQPEPPQLPAPPPPTAQPLTPPRPIAAPPPSQKPPPPPQQPPPPAVAPQPGGAAGGGGNGDGGNGEGGNGEGGNNGGGGPAERTPARPPGFIRIAP